MPAHGSNASSAKDCGDETQPLLRPGMSLSTGKLWTVAAVFGLTLSWCVLDMWNRHATSHLFAVEQVKDLHVNKGDLKAEVQHFEYPLTLAFMQFTFMSLFFLALWLAVSNDPSKDWSKVNGFDSRWVSLVVTHVFSTFWLQALMMPSQMMSLGVFAASRAIEVPSAALMRQQSMGAKYGGHSPATCTLMFAAAMMMFYAYTQIEECLCIWSGYGVALGGPALYIIYFLVLIVPAANAVCQEVVLVQLGTHPILLLALQNIGAAFLFFPCLIGAHVVGFEDIGAATKMMASNPEATMLTLWLCIQITAISLVSIGLIKVLDSFWAVALRSMRVVFWWLHQLILFYFASAAHQTAMSLSISRPHASLWSFAMFCSCVVITGAILLDEKQKDTSELKAGDKQAGFPVFKAV